MVILLVIFSLFLIFKFWKDFLILGAVLGVGAVLLLIFSFLNVWGGVSTTTILHTILILVFIFIILGVVIGLIADKIKSFF